jgi:DNA-binding NarL/FixJ family response regulator
MSKVRGEDFFFHGVLCAGSEEKKPHLHPLRFRNRWAFTLFTFQSAAFILSPQNMVMKKIAVLLVDDHTVVRQGLRALLSSEEDIEVIGEAENGRQAVMLARKTPPDVVVMDVAMPLLNGLEATRQILKLVPAPKVLVLTSYGDDECVEQMMQAGAAGYLIKQTAANDLLKAIREVQRGNAFFSPAIAKRLRDQCRDAFTNGRVTKKAGELTTREAEVLQLIAEGFSNKQIAGELSISIKTVEKHRQQVMNKLNIHDVAGLTRYAISKGMVERNVPPVSVTPPPAPQPISS